MSGPCLQLALFISCLFFVTDASSVAVIIRSQQNEYHNRMALEKKAELDEQIKLHSLNAEVILMHREWPIEGGWVIVPLFPDISRKYAAKYDWVMFIEDITNVDLKRLIEEVLPKHDPEKAMYFGSCLYDNEISIIHHFAFYDGKVREFKYPDFHAGWVMSKTLVRKVAEDYDLETKKSDFQIDVQHEIAMFLDKNQGVKMTCVKDLCGSKTNNKCVTSLDYHFPYCGDHIGLDDIHISVKTTKIFHTNRVQVVKDTWGKYVKNIIYYSNITDPSVPTIDCGVPNTERGHCGKMEAIILDAYNNDKLKEFPWLVIADDDSIIGLSSLVKLLNCYNPKIPIVLGERYGFGLNAGYGYGYITGGGSMVMSRGAVDAWVKHGCKCPSNDTPDDMFLGQCFSYTIGIPVTHSPRFHQARPQDYSDGYRGNLKPVSFHKHWEVDPMKVYQEWFADDDDATFGIKMPEPTQAPEPIPVPIPPTPTEKPYRDEL
ncbi:beta-1,3-glucosyltransferase-like [Clavelina lepadiformis]|uniref:beta-1,3-glucosyltransferase-like n=1 Tax=Clavelina lepadiformis TaxID=159417 RepID=UPI00404278E6